MRRFKQRLIGSATVLLLLVCQLPVHAQTVISLTIGDGNTEGFNDSTPVSPVGGNLGTTLGEQRRLVFERAAEIWGGLINSSVEITISAQFNPQTCGPGGTTLGSAGPTTAFGDFPNTPQLNRLYPVALANSLAGFDLDEGTPDINTIFNSDIDNGCSDATGWYYGLDGLAPSNQIELLPVVLHEIAHGLGFVTFTDRETGDFAINVPDIWADFLFDLDIGQFWINMTPAQRVASAINDPNLVWNGASVNAAFPGVLGIPELTINSPGSIASTTLATGASFGPGVPTQEITGQVVLVDDGIGDSTDGCSSLNNASAVNGNIALIRRGQCNFTVKTLNAQSAGAVAVIIANNVPQNLPPQLGGSDPQVNILTIGIEQALGNAMEAQLPAPGVNVTIGVSEDTAPGTTDGFVRMHAPDPVVLGSSVSHWTAAAFPNLLMQPFSSTVFDQVDLTLNLFEDIGWSINFPDTSPGPGVAALEPEGLYINTFTGQTNGQEAVTIRRIEGSNNLFSIANFSGIGHTASIANNGEVSISPLGVTGSFTGPDTASFNVPGGQVSAFNLQRVAMTDSDFLDVGNQPFPINPLYVDNWTLTETTFNPGNGAVIQTPVVFDGTLSSVVVAGGSQRLRIGQASGGQFIGFAQGSLASHRDFVIQIGNTSGNNPQALQTLPNNSASQAVNRVGQGRFVDINTFMVTSLLENRTGQPVLPQARVLVQQELTRDDPLLPGDLNNNGSINNTDRNGIIQMYGLGERDLDYNLIADVNSNGFIDLRDSAAVDGNTINLLPINDGISGSWFNTGRSGEGWNIAILPGGQRAIIAFFTFAPDGGTQNWIVGTGDIVNNEIIFNDLNLTGGAVFGAFDPDDVIRNRWGDLRMYFTDCNNGGVSYSSGENFGHQARSIQRLTNLAGVSCQQPNNPPPAQASQVVTGSWFVPARDGEGMVLEALADNRVVLYWYTYNATGGNQYWLGGVGTFNPANNTVVFDALNSSIGPRFGDAFDTNDLVQIPWGSATFSQSACNRASFNFNSTVPGFGSSTFNLVRLTSHSGIDCDTGQF